MNNFVNMIQSNSKIKIRSWKLSDSEDVWTVLKEGSFSNINSAFILCLRKLFVRGISTILFGLGIWNGFSPLTFVFLAILGIILIYLVCFIGTLVYLYVSYLQDIKNMKEYYFDKQDHHFWVAEYNGEIVGTIGIVQKVSQLPGSPFNDHTEANIKKVAWLRRMAVKNKFRGMGIAKLLVNKTIEFCVEQNYDGIFLITTEVHHAARALYARMGFHLAACKPYKYLKGLVVVETFEFIMNL
ncbi:unnamed protein product [Lymnaea stagnalis]|uniref:N-acetyltransferase domain-containing protein n=1 Tax=Lymnaea stagnalis TaxID=6523 RepID=A0AAV2H0N5_LYMST